MARFGRVLTAMVTPFHPDGSIDALFNYEGSTCSNIPLRYHYRITLGPRREGYPIRSQQCDPAPGDTGHARMCRFISAPNQLTAAIADEKPLLGQPLNDVLTWSRPTTGAGCYCEPTSRRHKWGLVLETLHYTLVQLEKGSPAPPENAPASSPASPHRPLPIVPLSPTR